MTTREQIKNLLCKKYLVISCDNLENLKCVEAEDRGYILTSLMQYITQPEVDIEEMSDGGFISYMFLRLQLDKVMMNEEEE